MDSPLTTTKKDNKVTHTASVMSTFVQSELAQHLERWEQQLCAVRRDGEQDCLHMDAIEYLLSNCRTVQLYALTAEEQACLSQVRRHYRYQTLPQLDSLLHRVSDIQSRAYSLSRDNLTLGETEIAVELEEIDEKQQHLQNCVSLITSLAHSFEVAPADPARLLLTETLWSGLWTAQNPSVAEDSVALTAAMHIAQEVKDWIVPRQVHTIASHEVNHDLESHGELESAQRRLAALQATIATEEAELSQELANVGSLLQDVATLERALGSISGSRDDAIKRLQTQFEENCRTIESQMAAALLLAEHSSKELEQERDALRRALVARRAECEHEILNHPLQERIRRIRDEQLRPSIRQLKADVETRFEQPSSVTRDSLVLDDIPTRLYLSQRPVHSCEQRLIVGMLDNGALVVVAPQFPQCSQVSNGVDAKFEIKGERFVVDLEVSVHA